MSLFSLSFASICKKGCSTLNISDVSVIYTHAPSVISGSDIVQWMIKNLDIEDQGKRADTEQHLILGRGFPPVFGKA